MWSQGKITSLLAPSLLLGLFVLFSNTAIAPTITYNQPAANIPPTTTLLAVGDVMLSRNVGAKIQKANDPNLPFNNLGGLISGADIAFANLECPLSSEEKPGGQGLVFRCPSKYVSGLVNAGFDVLAMANNHMLDQGADNIDFTLNYLESKQILPIGTFKSGSVNNSRVLGGILQGEVRFGFLAYSYTANNDGGRSQHPQIATMEIDQLRTDLGHMKQENGADVIIVSMHAGIEYTRHPSQQQIDFAHAAIDAGADAVIGHHPHWIQDIEIYKNKPIFYSLGNFVFDQMFSSETREGLAVKFYFRGAALQSADLIPVIIDNYCCPRLADENETAAILKKINQPQTEIRF